MNKSERPPRPQPFLSARPASIRVPLAPRILPPALPPHLVVFDTSYLAHRARWTIGGMEHKGRPTGVLYGVLTQVNKIRRLFPSNSFIVFAWDSLTSLRRERLPIYKASRKKELTREEKKEKLEFFEQMNCLRHDALEPMGFLHHVSRRGYEADDAIASLVNWAAERPREIGATWVVSNDDDLFQLLNRCSLYRPLQGANYTERDLLKEWNLSPDQWPVATAIAGDHNGVPGIKGVGVKTAARYLNGDHIPESKKKEIDDAMNNGQVEKNLEMILLPYKGTNLVPCSFSPDQYRLDLEGLEWVREELGFHSFREEEWA